ncbi:MAG: DNA gyrase inhibitor YacG [Candidatus Binatia bacterium]|nr:DNA gyrase inhibitor YacG [Candidatus Binatia bacterium]MDG1958391.1 DNA gyrase inhibitor YacG [Candidatus Binatia bacterium]MDG2009318.1 DNA gyrase inhibitor YacG [Candidatus Binatia bacterium]
MRSVKCPSCGGSSGWEVSPRGPFCSDRCRLADLGSWLEGDYAIAGDNAEVPEVADEDGT